MFTNNYQLLFVSYSYTPSCITTIFIVNVIVNYRQSATNSLTKIVCLRPCIPSFFPAKQFSTWS